MILSEKDTMLQFDDEVKIAAWGGLIVERTIELALCRCRQCEDACEVLCEVPNMLCVHCNNHHTQKDADGVYKGPHLGPRRVLERMAKIPKEDPTPPLPTPYRQSLPGYLGGPSEACPICGTVPACSSDCR